MLKTLDRYIIRQFLGTFFFILMLIMAIAVVFDISEKTEDFAEMNASSREIIVDYYFNFIIYYSNLFSGLFIFISVLLFTSRLAHRTEVIAMLSSGCLLYTSDAADERSSVDLGGRRIITKKKIHQTTVIMKPKKIDIYTR